MKHPSFSNPEDAVRHYKLKERAGFDLAPLQLFDLTAAANWERMKWFYEVGVGKTVCSTVKALMLGHHCHIVSVPPIIIPQWCKWLRTLDPENQTLEYRGNPKERKAMKLVGPRWIVMSHNIFRDDFERLLKELAPHHPHVITDESHACKNPRSQLFKKTAALSSGNHIQLLTGTPISKPEDTYAYVKLCTPQVYSSYAHFERLHIAGRDIFGRIEAYNNLELLNQNLHLQACMRTKEEMFPGIIKPRYQVVNYELDPQHLKLYKELVEEQLLLLPDGSKIDATTAQRLYHKTQQLIVNWDHFSGDETARSAIYDLIDQTIEETQCMQRGRSKLIIWTWYTQTSKSIMDYLEDCHAVAAYGGADSAKSIRAFMEDPSVRILVGQPQSCGMGLEPQHVCWENLFVEYSTSPLYFIQSAGRTDRKGQAHMPTMRIAVAEGTIQSSLHHRLLHNGDLVQQTVGSKSSIRDAVYGKI